MKGAKQVKAPSEQSSFSVLRIALRLMTARERRSALVIIAMMMMAGFLESAVVAVVVPLVYVVADPGKVASGRLGTLLGDLPMAELFPLLAGGLLTLLFLGSGANSLAAYVAEKHSARCRDRLARTFLERCIAAPYLWLAQRNTAILARKIHDDVRSWRKEYVQSVLMIVQSAIMIIFPSTVAVALAPAEGFAALFVVALMSLLVVMGVRKRLNAVSMATKLTYDATMKSLLQVLTGIREVKVSNRAGFFVEWFDRHHRDLNELGVQARMWGSAPVNIIRLLGQVGFIASALVLWLMDFSGAEIAAQLALIGVVVSRVVPAFNSLAGHVSTLFRAAPFVSGLAALLDDIDCATRDYGRSQTDGEAVPADWSRLTLDEVWFKYPSSESWSLRGIDLQLERGRFYGFVGRSGAGKSTLINALLGLIEPSKGAVRLDGRPLTGFALSDWHGRFGYVPQDVFLLDGTLRDNIAFGEAEPDDARIMAALEQARLGEMAAALEQGLDTPLGERGRRLSGGQAQRVAIARALYKKPQIMLLDEATSALDSVTEREIQQAIEQLRGEVLTLAVAHRVTSLRNCDRIFILDGGTVAESGTYEELLKKSEVFRSLAAHDPVSGATAP